jgi:hypothetical protein
MAHKRAGLLAQIEAEVADDRMPLSSLLQKCIVLGGRAGSEKMRDWARQELNGYAGVDTAPDYRHVPAAVMAMITNRVGYNGMTQRIDDSIFPHQIREMIREKVDLEDAILGEGVGVLEAMAEQGTDEHRLIPSWSSFIADTLNQFNMAPNSRVAEVYWSVSNASMRGVLVRVRTALAELVAELITLTPQDQEVPDKLAADQAVHFVLTGDRPTVHYSPQRATDGGTNVTVASSGPAPRPVTVSGAHGSVIGSQTASGVNSSVVGSQAANEARSSAVGGQSVQADHDAVTSGHDATDNQRRRSAGKRRLVGAPAEAGHGRRLRHHHRRYRRRRWNRRRDMRLDRLDAVSAPLQAICRPSRPDWAARPMRHQWPASRVLRGLRKVQCSRRSGYEL